MFTKTAILKKLMTQAYKAGGLRIGSTEDHTYISGSYWAIKVVTGHIPNKDKAAIIELTGEIPAPGEWFIAHKDAGNQMEVPEAHMQFLTSATVPAETEFLVTKIIEDLDVPCRVLQDEVTNKCILINDIFIKMIDYNTLDISCESYPQGPFAPSEEGPYMQWYNETTTLIAYIKTFNKDSEQHAFLKELSCLELPAERKMNE